MRPLDFWQRALCALMLALPVLATAQTAPVTVFAAASLKESMDEAAAAYQKASGTSVRVSYAASSALARQIEQGAPADVFFSADLEWMDYLQQRGLVVPAQRRNLLGNTLVLIAPAASKVRLDPRTPGAIAEALGENGRLAVGQTSSVPAGKYAAASLRKLGQWDGLSNRLAESESVRAALMLVSRGEAPLGIVYGSDARAEPKVRVVATFPADSHDAIVYPVAVLKNSSAPEATKFVQWLSSKQAKAIFLRRGFSLQD
ncbi:molybdate ABC transporter substrate-binding protein [Xanthomonas vesicatoria]|uniref:Molybdate ABC transporter substrate-binding protein n=1 Tax=Xanthomonas vesicatoria TaxID=56460 RepID=A0AAJ0IXM9_9XANT|nr:molybdate ABC transporter substrate-binding protein [Xanthomonas vesicatoria]APO94942.1 molybdate ABC transporter substrate-binding protein [Xanthomonas vesicatoria]KHM93641.1 molybdenum ABC transporter substrate-binding protein [Xanthomonas vesicatoria]KHM94741.1 molybdenum ABC transporter substrate-binding protein [Xanthomonas vesicatoria]MCC8621455.1 molybdate ABC transporter substrate-binding protein [Xanthomonas vesicatoria]MCC8693542.1 molybdate ABC transporter substrate-binding prote